MFLKCQKHFKMNKFNRNIIILSVPFSFIFCKVEDNGFYDSNVLSAYKVQNEYLGNWPKSRNKASIIANSNTNKMDCPYGVGCECISNNDCVNSNCQKDLRGNSYCALQDGDTFPPFQAIDQFDEILDIYDFSNNEGKYILLEMGTAWCSPCHSLASWLSWDEQEIKSKPFWRDRYNEIKKMVENGEVYFITVLYEDEFRDNANYDTVYEWYNTYPDDSIPILVDENKKLHSIIRPTGIPAITLLSPDMKIINLSSRGFNKSFDKLLDIIKEAD